MKKKKKWPKVLFIIVLVLVLLWGCVSLLGEEDYEDESSEQTYEQELEDENTSVVESDDQDSYVEEDSSAEETDEQDNSATDEQDTTATQEAEEVESEVESEPQYTRTNVKITFSSKDKDGNPIDDSIFAENKVTLVNLWEPWCGPCRMEMPDLETLYQENKDWGFMIIGVHSDNDGLSSVLKETGVTYPIVDSTDAFYNIINKTGAYPTTVFVDSEGYIIEVQGESYFVGYEDYYEWKDKIDSLK